MKAAVLSIAFLIGACASGLAAQSADKVGIVKGTITIKGRPTADAVVSVEGIRQESAKPTKPKNAMMDQRDMKFIPRVLPVVVGTTVDFPNNDNTWHNVYSASEAKEFNLGLYPPKHTRSVSFDKAGVVRILCNVHPQMEAFVVVKTHPFFSATSKNGSYQLSDVPLGKYVLEVWHPDFGTRRIPFELVREGQVATLDLDLKR
ncbi:MAG TPA: carboxypeptidase regulatory-like domain-containing protein [Candidatus Acidoferrales bacterium]|nr:carboxypeptidase regulatory-like domain-containing protein [Candidatus Acidoferrales bacterium]